MDRTAYLHSQTVTFHSFERDNPGYAAGQRRYILEEFSRTDRSLRILDVACGDGTGLRVFRELGFTSVHGFDASLVKTAAAVDAGYPVTQGDFHDLSAYGDASFDIVYSSHSLEHAQDPGCVLREFHRVLVPGGQLSLVLPFPDAGTPEGHPAKHILGTVNDDNGDAVVKFIEAVGFTPISRRRDCVRETEIWLRFVKRP